MKASKLREKNVQKGVARFNSASVETTLAPPVKVMMKYKALINRSPHTAPKLYAVAASIAFVLVFTYTSNRAVFAAQPVAATLRASYAPSSAWLPVQQRTPNIAEDDAANPKNTKKKENGSKTTEKPKAQQGQGGGRGRVPQPKIPTLNVTFSSDMPGVSIFLRQGIEPQKLGEIDASGKFTVNMTRGKHSIMASRQGHPIQSHTIEVRPGNTNFNFNFTPPVAKTNVVANAEPPPPATSGDDAASTNAPQQAAFNADEFLNRYLDVKETANLNASDWQLFRMQVDNALEREPDNTQLKAQSLFAQGQLAYLSGEYPGALVAFNKATLSDPKFVAAHYGLGNAYLATNQPAQAIRHYQQAVKLNAQLALAYKGMGDAFTKQGKSKDAKRYYDIAERTGGINPNAAASAASPPSNLGTATDLIKRKRWAEALKELNEISKTQQTADVFIYMGDAYIGLQQPLSAAPAYRKALELDPKSALAAYRYGMMMFEEREFAAAMEALESSLALDQTGASINRKRAREYADKARERLRKMQQ